MAAHFDMEAFVTEVSSYPFLYDKSSKEYKNIEMKRAVWEMIAKKFEITAPDAEKKWKVQRDRYNKENKKRKESINSGTGASEVYAPKWGLFPIMDSVLRKCSENSSSISSIQQTKELTVNSQPAFDYLQIVNDNDDNSEEEELSVPAAEGITNATSPAFACASFISPTTSKNTRKRKRENQVDPIMGNIQETTKSITEYFARKATQEDSTAKFCDYLCCRLRELKKKHRRDAMHAIENLMQRKEIENDEDSE